MVDGDTVLLAEGLSEPVWQLVRPRLAAALAALGLDREFGTVGLSVDDLPGDADVWYRLLPGTAEAPGPRLAITCHGDVFCRHQPFKGTGYPPQAVWDQGRAPRSEDVPDLAGFSADRTDVFLHHHLLTVADIRCGDLAGDDLPARLGEAFTAAWAVAVDGRLERLHLPGYPISERRGRFDRLFGTAGILLPDHWQIFQALWDGGLAGQRSILGAVRRLPGL